MGASNRMTVRFMLFLLLFLVVLFILFLLLVIPGIKEFKATRAQSQIVGLQNQKLERKIKTAVEELQKLERNESAILQKFQYDFNKTAFLHFAANYFDRVSLTPEKETTPKEALKLYLFKASVNAKSPVKFYEFIEGLKHFQGVCKINFPITMEERAGTLNIDFRMSIYKID